MITSSGKFVLEPVTGVTYDTADVHIFIYTQDETGDQIIVEIKAYKNTTLAIIGTYNWRTDAATINAETGSGSGEFANFFTAAQLAVKTYLEGLNPLIVFTIV